MSPRWTPSAIPAARRGVGPAHGVRWLVPLVVLAVGCGDRRPIESSLDEDLRRMSSDGVRLLDRGDLDAAEARFLEVLALSVATDHRAARAEALYNLASVGRLRGRSQEAIAELAESEDLFRRLDRPDGVARVLVARGDLLRALGRLDEAGADLARAREIAPRETRPEVDLALAWHRLDRADVSGARTAAEAALAGASGDAARADALLALGGVDLAAGDVERARARLEEALDLHRSADRRSRIGRALLLLGDAARAAGADRDAADFYDRAAGVLEALGWDRDARRARDAANASAR